MRIPNTITTAPIHTPLRSFVSCALLRNSTPGSVKPTVMPQRLPLIPTMSDRESTKNAMIANRGMSTMVDIQNTFR